MLHVIDEYRPHLSRGDVWLGAARAVLEAAAAMPAGLAGSWEVEHVADPFGQVSIIMLPARDDAALPAFLVYEKDGLARIATIRDDVWEGNQVFSFCPRELAATLAAALMPQEAGWFVRPTLAQSD